MSLNRENKCVRKRPGLAADTFYFLVHSFDDAKDPLTPQLQNLMTPVCRLKCRRGGFFRHVFITVDREGSDWTFWLLFFFVKTKIKPTKPSPHPPQLSDLVFLRKYFRICHGTCKVMKVSITSLSLYGNGC